MKTSSRRLRVALCFSLLAGGWDSARMAAGAPAAGAPAAGAPAAGSPAARAPGVSPPATPAGEPSAADAPALIHSLGAESPWDREAAGQRLLALGAPARPALLEAMARAGSPEVRGRCADLVLRLPWAAEDDPSPVRQMLAHYGRANEEQRAQLLAQIYQRGGRATIDVLLRALNEDPSDDVGWAVVNLLKDALAGREEQLRQLDAAAARAPSLALAGMAWASKDPAKAADLFRRAQEAEAARPSRDGGAMDRVEQQRYAYELIAGRPARAAEVVRLRHLRADGGAESAEGAPATSDAAAGIPTVSGYEGTPAEVLQVFVLHATFGPLEGFDRDARAYRPWLGNPDVMYALGRAYGRGGRAALEQACYRCAFAANPGDSEGRVRMGEFLLREEWEDLAEAEFRAALAPDGEPPAAADLMAHSGLARIATAREDDAAAAEHWDALVASSRRTPAGNGAGEEFQAQLNWHRMRQARAQKDGRALDELLAQLLASPPQEGDAAIDVVVALKELDRPDDARRLFDDLYRTYRQRLDDDPNNPERKNNLAWLCARTGEKLDEAVALSQAATRAAPNNYAYLDTAAEACFRAGRKQEAAALEAKALRVRPDNRFMRQQLWRFSK